MNRCSIDVSLNESREPVENHYARLRVPPFKRGARQTSTPAQAVAPPRLRCPHRRAVLNRPGDFNARTGESHREPPRGLRHPRRRAESQDLDRLLLNVQTRHRRSVTAQISTPSLDSRRMTVRVISTRQTKRRQSLSLEVHGTCLNSTHTYPRTRSQSRGGSIFVS